LPTIFAAQPNPIDGHLLSIHHTVPGFFSPAITTPLLILLMTWSYQSLRLFFHHQHHQTQARLFAAIAHAILDQLHYFQQRHHQLHGAPLLGDLPNLPNRSLLPNFVSCLVSYLHSDSPFLTFEQLTQRLSRP